MEQGNQEEAKSHILMYDISELTSELTLICSSHRPDFIFSLITLKLQEMDVTPVISEKKWKMTFEFKRNRTDKQAKLGVPFEGCRVSVKILKIDDDKVCVEFIRLSGDTFFYQKHFQYLKENLREINDVVYNFKHPAQKHFE